MTYVIMTKHGILGEIVIDITDNIMEAKKIRDDIAGSWIEEIDSEGEV